MGIRRASIGVAVVLVALSQMVGAVNIIGYPRGACRGSGVCFNGIHPTICALFDPPVISVLFDQSRPCQDCNVYKPKACGRFCSPCNNAGTKPGGGTCFTGGPYTAANYNLRRCGQTSVVEDVPSAEASQFELDVTTVEPSQLQAQNATGVVYTEDPAEGHWILTAPNALELFDAMESLPECEKSAWLQARGATFMANAEGRVQFE